MGISAIVFLAVAVSIGCRSPTLPSWSHRLSPGDRTPPPVRQPAKLEIRNASALVRPEVWGSYRFGYTLEFDLVETVGESSAAIRTIRISIPDEYDELMDADADCFGGLRIRAGNSLRVDEKIGWCAPTAASRREVTGVSVEVSFVDDYLRTGSISAVVPVRR